MQGATILPFPSRRETAQLSEADQLIAEYLRIDAANNLDQEQRATAYLCWLQHARAYGNKLRIE